MTAAQIALPPKLKPLFIGPADVRASHGGRGSAKTRSFAKMCAVKGYMFGSEGISGIILCARQFMNSLEDSSLEEVKRAIEDEPWLAAYYDVGDKYIKSRDGLIQFAFAGLDRSLNSIKSKGRLLLCWVDEGEPVTAEAWSVLIPTLREEGTDWNAELWVTWNPKRRHAACEARFRGAHDERIRVVEMNWRDNPKFPAKLERDRQRDLAERPDQYEWVWEGKYISVNEGAYYARDITKARAEGRVGFFPADPMMTLHVLVDIGGTGARADAFTMWVAQFIGAEIRLVDYYESVGQPISTHLSWMRRREYTPARCQVWLPHDGDTQDKVYDASYAKAFDGAQFRAEVVPNQGKGAAKLRIEAARRHFHACRFNVVEPVVVGSDGWPVQATCSAGLEALGWYHEKKDETREIGLGPNHDWSSHGADSFGLMAIVADKIIAEANRGPAVDPNKGHRRAY